MTLTLAEMGLYEFWTGIVTLIVINVIGPLVNAIITRNTANKIIQKQDDAVVAVGQVAEKLEVVDAQKKESMGEIKNLVNGANTVLLKELKIAKQELAADTGRPDHVKSAAIAARVYDEHVARCEDDLK